MHIRSKSTVSINQATNKINDKIFESKLELKNLGVIVDNDLTFSNHIAEKVINGYSMSSDVRLDMTHLGI